MTKTSAILLCVALAAAGVSNAQRKDTVLRVGVTVPDEGIQIQTVPLEIYVARVLAGEGQPRAADAAQEALAIAVRTFALANRNRHRGEGYGLCDTTHCQVLRPETPATTRAAAATAGRVLVHEGEPAMVFYSAWCGGRSELASEVWPGALNYAFEPSQKDDACRDEPEWTSEISVHDLARAMQAAGLAGDRLRDLRILQRNASGRVTRLRVDGFTPAEISGVDFRMAIGRIAGWQTLKSTAFEMRRASDSYVFTGRGYGHGVGLCVVGAGYRAARGATAEEILRFYYPGLRVEQYAPRPIFIAEPASPKLGRDPASEGGRSADVLVSLPAADESARAMVTQLIRKTRDEITARTGVRSPATIRVTIHASLEDFARATGQPWWVSGATAAAAIDLAPLANLRQQGQLERAIRREVAHAMLDPELANRPLWIREGAALYFASLSPGSGRQDSPTCPSDAELLRPVSAGAHREAVARAEACFRRQIAGGRTWRDVR